ncbi:hypothetical protein [Desulforhopalus singaporensis]|uniref:Uncharacterized protein n=1 Tax=Desulforhopalus singaporensis TaxID=91360 RepID=A0A1H0VHI5_9BACT|nr:hypothetical protein [Desulforhopalus singaporensis]SDP78019.1 hypothetical protein SAMN05660330_04079 [Desulforhopalus singaporensis]
MLQKAGYPFEADDLSLDEWMDLGRIRELLESKPVCPLMTISDE